MTRYVEQLVASAEAAVEEVIRRGVSLFIPRCMTTIGIKLNEFVTESILCGNC